MDNRIIKHRHKCTVPGCTNVSPYIQYCGKHRYRIERYGSPFITKQQSPGALKAWIEAHAGWADQEACLIWPFAVSSHGYPIAGDLKGHSYMCEVAHGPKPEGKDLAAHSCDVKACVNPHHLRWATYKENSQDQIDRDRQRKGAEVWTAKLSEQDVRDIRAAERGYGKTKALAERYGVSTSTINHIWRGDGWRHVA